MRRSWLGIGLIILGILALLIRWQSIPSQITQYFQDERIIDIQGDNPIPQVVDASLPSVVTIQIQRGSNGFNPFRPFSPMPDESQERNIASGFIVSTNGLIITNKHVVADMEATYNVVMDNGDIHPVAQIYRDPLNDLALIQVNIQGLPPLPLGRNSDLKLGQTVVAIGTPLGEFTNTVTSGIISGLERGIEATNPARGYVERLDNVIQTDAAINPGNSGGPLLDLQGRVVGVNTAIAAGGQNISFAIPVDVVRDLLTEFEVRGGSFSRPYIGVRYQMIDEEAARQQRIPEGAFIHEVLPQTPSERAGLLPGDVIIEFNDKAVANTAENNLTRLLAETAIGTIVPLVVWRDGESREYLITIDQAP
jgi:serine protease Do